MEVTATAPYKSAPSPGKPAVASYRVMELRELEGLRTDLVLGELEAGWKRRKENETEVDEDDESLQDPLEVLGTDITLKILKGLDDRSLGLSLLVSRAWNGVVSCDTLWTPKCEELWLGKAHIPRSALAQGLSKLAAYSLSIVDSQRTRIREEDLCDHAWEFHFNQVVSEYWLNLDPYWIGTSPLMRRYFHRDGSLTAGPGDRVWGGHECCYTIVTGVDGGGKMREHCVRINRRLPQMFVSRKLDWSWEMSNVVYCYASVPDAHRDGCSGSSACVCHFPPDVVAL